MCHWWQGRWTPCAPRAGFARRARRQQRQHATTSAIARVLLRLAGGAESMDAPGALERRGRADPLPGDPHSRRGRPIYKWCEEQYESVVTGEEMALAARCVYRWPLDASVAGERHGQRAGRRGDAAAADNTKHGGSRHSRRLTHAVCLWFAARHVVATWQSSTVSGTLVWQSQLHAASVCHAAAARVSTGPKSRR